MNEFEDASDRDPLDRLVEAFVEQSAPVGPDAATQRRLLAAMTASSLEPATRCLATASDGVEGGSRRWAGPVLRQALGLAAGIAVVVAGAFALLRRDRTPETPAPRPAELASAPSLEKAGEGKDRADLTAAIDRYLRHKTGRIPDEQTLRALFAAVFRDNADLSDSPRWRDAQQRLTYALEQPEVIGLSVGLLGTLPWTTYGRF